jgi:hypothetical protein
MAGRVDVVVNVSSQPVMVMWDGVQVAFAPGEKKILPKALQSTLLTQAQVLSWKPMSLLRQEEPSKRRTKESC